MEKVSEERLEQAIKCFLFGARPDVGTEQTRQEDAEMASALSELRELRKLMGAVEKALERPGNTVVVYRAVYANKAGWRARLMEDSGAHFKRSSAGDSLRSALAALVKGGEAAPTRRDPAGPNSAPSGVSDQPPRPQ